MKLHKAPMESPVKHLAESWVCPMCTFHNLALLSKCEMCDADRFDANMAVDVVEFDCPWCTSKITSCETICSVCGNSLDEAPVSKPQGKVIPEQKVVVKTEETEPEHKKEINLTEKGKESVTASPLTAVINPEIENKGRVTASSEKSVAEEDTFLSAIDLFGEDDVAHEEKPTGTKPDEPKVFTLPNEDDVLIGEGFFTEEAPPSVPTRLIEAPVEGLGIGCLYDEPEVKPAEKKIEKEAEEELYLICEKCSFRNDITNILCYTCGFHLLDRIETEPMKAPTATVPSGVCKMCSYENPPDARVCEMCTFNLTSSKMLLNCPYCTMENHVTSKNCVMCEKELPETGYNKKLYEECTICMGILDIDLFEAHVKDCKQNQRLLQELKDEQETLTLQEKCPYCKLPFFRLDFEDHIQKCPEHESYYSQAGLFGALTPVQTSTIKFMHENSHKQHFSAKLPLQRRLEKLGYKLQDMEQLYEYIHERVPLIIHIHISKHMQFFVKDTNYRNQFETGKSSGSTNLVSRKSWETRMFMKRYDASPHHERVKYGTVNYTNDPRGVNSCRSYGNSYLVLKKEVRDRCTLTDQDSSNNASLIGTFKFCYHVLNKLTDAEIKATIRASKGEEVCSSVVGTYKQIQIHGPIDFARDIERMYVNEVEYNTPKLIGLVDEFSKKFGIPFQLFK